MYRPSFPIGLITVILITNHNTFWKFSGITISGFLVQFRIYTLISVHYNAKFTILFILKAFSCISKRTNMNS